MIQGDCLDQLALMEDQSTHCCVTSPPYYGLRDYGVEGQIGLEETPERYIEQLVDVFREVRRVLRDDGTVWLNLGDSYSGSGKASGRTWEGEAIPKLSAKQGSNKGSLIPGGQVPEGTKPKDLLMIPARVALALQADGWWLRSDIIWHKPNPIPESVRDRPTSAHEHIFLLSKNKRYYYDADAIAEESTCDRIRGPADHPDVVSANGNGGLARRDSMGTRNRRNVWTVATKPYKEAHFATFPSELIEPCILAGCPPGGTVLDLFAGAGTTLLVANQLGRKGIGIELNPEYCALARRRIQDDAPLFNGIGNSAQGEE
jgi:DNA modification methylase